VARVLDSLCAPVLQTQLKTRTPSQHRHTDHLFLTVSKYNEKMTEKSSDSFFLVLKKLSARAFSIKSLGIHGSIK